MLLLLLFDVIHQSANWSHQNTATAPPSPIEFNQIRLAYWYRVYKMNHSSPHTHTHAHEWWCKCKCIRNKKTFGKIYLYFIHVTALSFLKHLVVAAPAVLYGMQLFVCTMAYYMYLFAYGIVNCHACKIVCRLAGYWCLYADTLAV